MTSQAASHTAIGIFAGLLSASENLAPSVPATELSDQQLGGGDAERVSKGEQIEYGRIALTTLDTADVCPVQVGLLRKLLL